MSGEPLFIAGGASSPVVTAELAGSKAAELWRMASLGLDVPPAFVLPTTLCAGVNAGDPAALQTLERGLAAGVAWLEERTGRRLGDGRAPLLVSVRSGAAVSMPGMLQTVLDIGLNEESVHGLIRLTGNPRLAFDCWRRLIQSYAEVVGDVPAGAVRPRLADMIAREQVEGEAELDSEALERLAGAYRELGSRLGRGALPDDPARPARQAARAVFRSWQAPRAVEYRRLNGLSDAGGTAVTVQAMVFGNSGAQVRRRRGLQPQPGDRRGRALPRLPVRRAGRGRGVRPPHADRCRAACGAPARGRRAARSTACAAIEQRAARRPGCRVHGRGGPSLFPADPRRASARRSPRCAWRSPWCTKV